MTLRPSTAPHRVPLLSPLASSLPALADPESNSLCAASPTVTRLLATVVTDPSFESTAASALVAELIDFAAHCRLDYAASLVAEFASVCPPSIRGECALGTDVLEDRQEEFECFAAAVPHLVSMLLAPEGDPDAPDISTLRSYAQAIEGSYSSQWQAAMDAKMSSWKSTGTYVDEVPPHGANIVSGMWIFRVKRPPGSPPVFKARSLHEEIWLRRPPGFTGSFPPGTQWCLRRPVYGLRQAPREWHDTLRTTLATLRFTPSTANPSLFLRTDATLPPFYVLVFVDNLVFATADTEALAHVKSELQKRHTCTDLGELTSYLGLRITRDRAQCTITLTQSHMVQQVLHRFGFTYSSPHSTPLPTGHSLSAPPSDESVELSGPYPELVGCIISRCEGGIYTGAMAAQELCWLTYVLTDLGEAPRSPPVLYVDNKAMLPLCQEHRLEHRTKHIALPYFLARELQQRGQLRLAYVASWANTADVFTKALQPCDHQPCFAFLDQFCDLFFSPTLPMGCAYKHDLFFLKQAPEDPSYSFEDPFWYNTVTKTICVPADHSLRQLLLSKYHDTVTSSHFGVEKTYARLSNDYHWPRMHADVREFIRSCPTCQQFKAHATNRYGLLQPIPPPIKVWDEVTMDFIMDLPRTPRSYNAILVVVDRLSKMTHFIPTHTTVTAPDTARLFFDHIVRLHGFPSAIILDRDPRFLSNFWQSLFKLHGTRLKFSTVYHPETDGQTEQMNRTLEDALPPTSWSGVRGAANLQQWASWSTGLVDLHGSHCKGTDFRRAPTSGGRLGKSTCEGVDLGDADQRRPIGCGRLTGVLVDQKSCRPGAGRPRVWSTWLIPPCQARFRRGDCKGDGRESAKPTRWAMGKATGGGGRGRGGGGERGAKVMGRERTEDERLERAAKGDREGDEQGGRKGERRATRRRFGAIAIATRSVMGKGIKRADGRAIRGERASNEVVDMKGERKGEGKTIRGERGSDEVDNAWGNNDTTGLRIPLRPKAKSTWAPSQ
ncbi:unnamed protein product [Closterium sp. NIES-53]